MYSPGICRPSSRRCRRIRKCRQRSASCATRASTLSLRDHRTGRQAPMVGANLDVMETDARRMRGIRPFVFSNLKSGKGADEIAHFILQKGGLASADLLA